MTPQRFIELYSAFREAGYQRLDGKIPPTPYPLPIAVWVRIALGDIR